LQLETGIQEIEGTGSPFRERRNAVLRERDAAQRVFDTKSKEYEIATFDLKADLERATFDLKAAKFKVEEYSAIALRRRFFVEELNKVCKK
jgi:hypothetical protein